MGASSTSVDEFVGLAHELAEAAAVVQRRYFRQPVGVDIKADDSPVTIADRESEAAMRDILKRRVPGHGVLGEEYGAESADAEFLWILDPIDGTKSFISGRPLFGTLIALFQAGRPLLGIIDQSIISERWLGVRDRRTLHNGKPVQVRPCPSLTQATLYTTTLQIVAEESDRHALERVTDRVRYPFFNGDCYAYGLVTLGFVDLVVEAGLQTYDYAALIPIIEGAGGCLTDWEGAPMTLQSDGRVVAAGDRRIHEETLALLDVRSAV